MPGDACLRIERAGFAGSDALLAETALARSGNALGKTTITLGQYLFGAGRHTVAAARAGIQEAGFGKRPGWTHRCIGAAFTTQEGTTGTVDHDPFPVAHTPGGPLKICQIQIANP